MPTHDIGYAAKLLKEHKRVTRPGWNGKGMWLGLWEPRPDALAREEMTRPFVFMKTAQGGYIPWLCSAADLLAEDYEEVV